MSQAEFECLVEQYLDRSASTEDVARLRQLLSASPELTRRFKQREKLHRAQVKCLANLQVKGSHWLYAWLLNMAQRFNRSAAYACLLMLILVQTKVTLDTDYKGLNLYVLNGLSVVDGVDDYELSAMEFAEEAGAEDLFVADASALEWSDDDE